MSEVNSSEIRKVAQCVYLACDESIAADISVKCKRIADAYDKLQADNELLRDALAGMLDQFDSEEDCANEADYIAVSMSKKALAATKE